MANHNLPALRLLQAQAERLADELDRLIADIEVALDGHTVPVPIDFPPSWPCVFVDVPDMPALTDISLAGGADVFRVAGGMR